jgi:murein DD-endopeptidase MepM/ murein hydrolase activator NlpD
MKFLVPVILVALACFFRSGGESPDIAYAVDSSLGDIFAEQEEPAEAQAPQQEVDGEMPEGPLKVLLRREQILRAQLDELERERSSIDRERDAIRRAIIRAAKQGDIASKVALENRLREVDATSEDIGDARGRLVAFQQDRERYEQFVVEAYEDSTYEPPDDSESAEYVPSYPPGSITKGDARVPEAGDEMLSWPVLPDEGISAGFLDAGYLERFGFKHYAIDVPVEQESPVRSAASGVVEKVRDRGLGYSTITIRHSENLTSVYGHISSFSVQEGQKVAEGQIIGLSGGRPGTPGAGPFSTGPHLHFEVRAYGQPMDPIFYLPETPFTIVEAY